MADSPPNPVASQPQAVPAPRRRRGVVLKLLGGAVTLLLTVIMAVGAGLWWALGTPDGSAWLLSKVPGLQVDSPRGALAGDFSARRLVIDLNKTGDRVTLDDVGWRGLALLRGDGRRWARLTIEALSASRVDVVLAAKPQQKPGAPPKAPANLQLPLELELKSLKVGELRATPLGAAAITNLDAALHLGAEGGAVHRINRLALEVERITVAARARIASAAPMALNATVDASQAAVGNLPGWLAKLQLAGPIAEPVLDASLRSSQGAGAGTGTGTGAGAGAGARAGPSAGPEVDTGMGTGPAARALVTAPARSAQTLDLHATLRPFAAWPLGELTARSRGLDVSAFLATAPRTAIDLEARAASSGTDQPATVTLALTNSLAGPYDQGRLPVQSLRAEIVARPDRATEVELRSVDIAFGSTGATDGRINAHGRWSPSRWQVAATVDALKLRRLDGRAPAMTLTGPVDATGDTTAAVGQGIALKAALAGQLDEAGKLRPVSLRLETSFDLTGESRRLQVANLAAAAGEATLKASGNAIQAGPNAPWVVKLDAALAEFDPGLWLPGDNRSPWKSSRNRINARVGVDATAPVPAAGSGAVDLLAASRGRASLAIGDGTILAGVAVGGSATARSDNGRDAQVRADIVAGGNSLHLDGRLGIRGRAAPATTDAFDLTVDARTLATLAPVFKLFQPAGADATLTGRVTAHAHVDGRWPTITSHGDLDAQEFQAGPLRLQRAVAQWQAGTAATDRMALDANVQQLHYEPKGGAPGPSLESATVQLTGTARAHTLAARLTSRARPPAWAEAVTLTNQAPASSAATAPTATSPTATGRTATGRTATDRISTDPTAAAPIAPGSTAAPALAAGVTAPVVASTGRTAPPTRVTVATLTARGGLVDQPGAALSGWRGTLQSADLGADGTAAVPLLRARDLSLEAFWGGGPVRAAVRPGRLEVLGGVVRWSRLEYAAAPAASTPAVPPGTSPRSPSADIGSPVAALPRIEVDATIEPLRVAPLLAQAQPTFGWGGDLGIGGRIRLSISDSTGVRADILFERSSGDLTISDELGTRPLRLTEARVSLTADRGLWSASTRFNGASLGTAKIDASARTSPQALTPPADAPLVGKVELNIGDLGALGNWVPPGWRVGGALRADAVLGGRVGKPDYTGQVIGSQITARNFLEGVKATDGDFLVRLAGSTATIDHFTAKGGDGLLSVTGNATFDDTPALRLDITADRFQLLGRIDRKIVTSGQAAVRLNAKAVAVTGRFSVDQGLFDITRSDAPKLDEDVTVVRAAGVLSPEAAASAAASPGNNAPVPTLALAGPPAPEAPPPVRAVDLDLQVDLGKQLAIRGHGLAARLAGVLKVSSPQGKLAVNGTVSVVDGTFKAYGQDLVIDRGLIAFTGPVDRPRLDIEATRPKLDNLRVGVTITGSTANPRIRLFSEPELSDVDKLSWLVVGRGSDDLGRNESALLQSAAMALVSGEGNGEPGITDRVTKALGLDELSLGQSEGAVKQTVVNVGKKLSDRWTIGYQGGLNAATGSVQLIYRIAKRLTVRAQAGSESSLDLIWTWRWQ